MAQKIALNARALLAGNINAAATELTVEPGKADRFPIATAAGWPPGSDDWFKVTLTDNAGNMEVLYVGTRGAGSNTFGNLQRGQEGTTARSWTAGSTNVQLTFTATDLFNAIAGIFASLSVSGNAAVGGNLAVTGNTTVTGNHGVTGNLTVGGTMTTPAKFTAGDVVTRPVPVGGIVMWSGRVATIPAGWQLCDGTNGTPDLRDRFVVGARQDNVTPQEARTNVTGALTKSGGSKDAIVVSHTHGATVNDPQHAHDQVGAYVSVTGDLGGLPGAAGVAGGYYRGAARTSGYVYGSATGITVTNASTGSSGTNANLPPYYALAFIQCMA